MTTKDGIVSFVGELEERQEQALEILKTIHKTKAGQELIHTEKCLTNKEGYDFACPVCGATVEFDGTVNLPETKTKAQCQACNKQVKKESLKEKILFGIIGTAYAAWLCPKCYDSNQVVKVNHKRQLKKEFAYCDDCKQVFDADTRQELDKLTDAHHENAGHAKYQVLQQNKEN